MVSRVAGEVASTHPHNPVHLNHRVGRWGAVVVVVLEWTLLNYS